MPFNNKRNSRDDNSGKNRSNSKNFRSQSGRSREQSSTSGDRKFNPKSTFGKPKFDKFEKRDSDRPFSKFDKSERRSSDRSERGFDRSERRSSERSERNFDRPERSFNRSERSFDRSDRKSSDRPFNRGDKNRNNDWDRKPNFEKGRKFDQNSGRSFRRYDDEPNSFKERTFHPRKKIAVSEPEDDGLIRLNRYISNSGICSRRKADELIQTGQISVNGEVVTELGTKVDPTKDEVHYNDERLKREKMVYVLLNKPKDFITTTDDPQERKTVMHLVAKASKERIYPVGRLDRNTTGLLLLTNDGNLAEKLAHPRNNVSKIYHVELTKSLTQGDFNKIQFGIELEDGFIKPDDLSYVQGASKREIGIQIHSGKNRVVRRIFESLGYEVVKLDRVVYANLTKKDLPRGRWRYLEERELVQLKKFIK